MQLAIAEFIYIDNVPMMAIEKQNQQMISYWLEGKQKVVLSRFGDSLWDITPYYHRKLIIDFSTCVFPDNSRLTDLKHKEVCRSVKEYIYCLLGTGLGVRTVYSQFESMKVLLIWMVAKKDYRQFCEIENAKEFVAFAKMHISRAPKNITRTQQVSKRTLAGRLQALDNLWRFREKLRDTLLAPPWPRRTAGSIAGRDNYDEPKTLAIPDELFRQLLQRSIEFIETQSQRLLETQQACESMRVKAKDQRDDKLALPIAREFGYSGLYALRTAFIKLRTCCYVVFASFVGPRSSEALSIERDCIEESSITLDDVVYPLIYIHGTTYKGKKDKKGSQVAWLANEAVVKAVEVLDKVSAPYREALHAEIEVLEAIPESRRTKEQINQLVVAKRSRNKLFLGYKDPVCCISRAVINQDLKRLCREFSILDEHQQPWKCHSHQFRRTLARFAARSRLGDPKYLQHHFKHWSSHLTWYYMRGDVDKELIDYMDDEYRRYVEELYQTFLSKKVPLEGGRGRYMLEQRDQLAHYVTFDSLQSLASLIPKDMRIKAQPHSFCMTSKHEPFCGAECLYNQTKCIDCKNGVIHPMHLPIWQDIEKRQQAILSLSGLSEAQKQDAQDKLKRIQAVIQVLQKGEHP